LLVADCGEPLNPDNSSVIFSGHMVNTSGTIGFDTLAGHQFRFFRKSF
jgi:hypothetical protein